VTLYKPPHSRAPRTRSTLYYKGSQGNDPMPNRFYQIEIDNSDDTTSVLYAKRPLCATQKGRDAQHNRMVNQVVEGIRDVRGWKRLTVSVMTPDQVSTAGLI